MSRLFTLTLFGLAVAATLDAAPPAAPAPASVPVARIARPAVDAPELLLSPTTQLYARWDGITAHNEAYKNSIWGPIMAGPTGDSIRALLEKGPKLIGNPLLAEPLLNGKSPKDLKASLSDLKNATKIINLAADKGILIGAEVREPAPTLKGIGSAIGGLLGGKMPGADAITPDAQILVVVPDCAEQAEVLFSAIRLALKYGENGVEKLPAETGRTGYQFVVPKQGGGGPLFALHLAWWVEGPHFVLYAGTMKVEAVMKEVAGNAKKGGVTGHPLFQRIQQNPGFESIARGFVDAGRIVTVAKSVLGPFVPGTRERLDDLGLNGLKAAVFNSGFDGKESRAVWEFDLPGERKGLAKVLKQQHLGLNDLPPMPPDVSRFSALRVDPTATYNAGIMAAEALTMFQPLGGDEDAKSGAEKIRARREYLENEFEKLIGLKIREDVLPYTGDKVVVFQSPTEGISLFGTVVCVSLKDPAKIKIAADRINRGLETLASGTIKVRKKTLRGVEIRELYSRGFGIITPTYAFVGEWLVVSAHPQAVQGFILRTKGELESWKPDAATSARLAKMPADGCGIQFCRPQSTVQNLCCIGPLLIGQLALINRFNQSESDYDPIDVGLIPNGLELSKHLFPNLTITRDDGKTVRIEVNESFSLPGEVIGLEPIVVLGTIFGFQF